MALSHSTTSELVPDSRQQQAGYPPSEEERTAEKLEGELPRSKVRPQTIDDPDQDTTNDAEPPQRVRLERTIEERLRNHAHRITCRSWKWDSSGGRG